MPKILSLDPGEETGYAIIDFADQTMTVLTYGVIPITSPGLGGLLLNVAHWVDKHLPEVDLAAFEDFIPSQRLRTTREAGEVRGVIRYVGELTTPGKVTAYMPQSVRSALGLKDKKAIRAFIQDLLGFKVRGKDHVTDAIAVGMCHAVKLGLWHPNKFAQSGDFSLTRELGGKQTSNNPDELAKLRGAELAAAIKSGKVRIGK